MADLENLLLEAAGRTRGGGRNRHAHQSSRRREKSYSDDGSDSKDDDSDDDRGYSSRKPSGSQVPLKKRSKDRDDDEQGSQDDEDERSGHRVDSGDDSDVGSDLYKDEDDRQKLAQLTELERELILSDRATKIDDKKLQEKVRSRWKTDKKPQPKRETTPPIASSSRSIRSSTRSADRAAQKADVLNELRAKRMKQQGSEASRAGFAARGYSPMNRKPLASTGLSSSSDSESGSHSDDGRRGVGRMDDSDDERSKPRSNIPTFEEIKSITIRRAKLAKWFMEPFFEDLIVGCFVRVGIGMKSGQSIYRLCIVCNVDASDPDRQYKLENKMTYKYLNCVWGSESSAARWQMARISDHPPLEEEYRQWMREVERSGARMPTKQEVLEKEESIEKISSYVYSAETVKQMLQDKKSATTRPLNIAAEKEKLRRELDLAQYKNDKHKVERIQARLLELEAVRQSQEKDSKALRLAEMNRKNRVENFRNASELKPVNTSLKAGEAGYDPFSRRWTRSRNYYSAKPEGGSQALTLENDGGDRSRMENGNVGESGGGGGSGSSGGGGGSGSSRGGGGGVAATKAALEAAAQAGKLVDTSAPLDQGTESNTLHDFEIPISLAALQKFGGPQGAVAGFLARKQRVEATIGYSVPENDGRRHALTLTVSDYKRRRGLL